MRSITSPISSTIANRRCWITDAMIGSTGTVMNSLPQGFGEREPKLERHREALEPLGKGREMANGGDHFGNSVVDVGVAGAAPDLEQRDLAVVEDDELDNRHASPAAELGGRQQIVMLPDPRMH